MTSPSLESTHQLFRSAKRQALQREAVVEEKAPGLLEISQGELRFVAVPELLSGSSEALRTCASPCWS